MTIRLAALATMVVGAFLPTASIQAQATDPAYLSQMPAVDRVMAEIQGPDPMDTAARQMGAFWQLQKIVEDLAGDRRYSNQLTPDEGTLVGQYRYGYELANQPYAHITYAPSHPDKPAWFKLYNFYLHDEGLLDELLQRFFSPEFRTAYYQASGKQPPTQPVAASAPTPGAQAPAHPSAPAGESWSAYLKQADEYYRDKDYPKAIDAYKRTIALEPSLGTGRSLLKDKDGEWLLAIERNVAQNPSDPLALILLGDTHRDRFFDYQNALEAYRRARDLKPSSRILASIHTRIGQAYIWTRDHAEAVRAFREALRVKPEGVDAGGTHAYLGFAFYKLEQYPEALVELQEGIRLSPSVHPWHAWAGMVYLEGLKQYDKALASFQEAIRLNPNEGEYRLLLGQTYLAMGKKEEALQVYRDLQAIDAERAQQLYAEINESS